MRMKTHRLFAVFCIFACARLAAAGESLGKVRIVDVETVAKQLKSVSVLDARSRGEFMRGHIPGSQRVSWKEWTQEKANLMNYLLGDPTKWGRVAEPNAQIQSRLRALGLSDTKPIVVVGNPHAWGEEGRIAWNLLYWGAKDVALLDGGFPIWQTRNKSIEKGRARKPAPGKFVVSLRSRRRAGLQTVLSAVKSKSRSLLDARTAEEFQGKTSAGQKRGGHIPGAFLVPEASLYRADGRYLDVDELRKLLPPQLSGSPITYCVGGVRSALLALMLEARLGITASNYDGSIWEWSAHHELPMSPTVK